jgi:hypothetical protein
MAQRYTDQAVADREQDFEANFSIRGRMSATKRLASPLCSKPMTMSSAQRPMMI